MGKTALITGGSSGIGFELAKLFAADGYSLLIAALGDEMLTAAKRDLESTYGVEVFTLNIDLSEAGAGQRLHAFGQQQGLTVDVLVNNAGFGSYGYFHETDLQHEEDMLMVIGRSMLVLTKLYYREMLERNSGRILNIASIVALQPVPKFAAYSATKAYVHHLSLALNHEARIMGKNVTVTAVCPAQTRTNFAKASNMESNQRVFHGDPMAMDADYVAKHAYQALNRGQLRAMLPSWSTPIYTVLYRLLSQRAIMGLVHWGLRE